MKKSEGDVKETYDPIVPCHLIDRYGLSRIGKWWLFNHDFGNKFLVNPKDFSWKW